MLLTHTNDNIHFKIIHDFGVLLNYFKDRDPIET